MEETALGNERVSAGHWNDLWDGCVQVDITDLYAEQFVLCLGLSHQVEAVLVVYVVFFVQDEGAFKKKVTWSFLSTSLSFYAERQFLNLILVNLTKFIKLF